MEETLTFFASIRYDVRAGRDTEVDFVAVCDKKTKYYQVSATVLDENTLQRELASLKQIKDNYPKFLITLDDFIGDHDGIEQVNLIDWLMRNEKSLTAVSKL